MSHQHDDDGHQIVQLEAKDIADVEPMEYLRPIESLIFRTALYLLSSKRFSHNAPFKGFLLQGTVGTGKTEIVRQVARHLGEKLGGKVHTVLVPVDPAVDASPSWGESEQVFQDLFALVKELRTRHNNPKVLLLFDDMESLMIARGIQAAREWHYSLNSVFFHLVDNMNPFQSMVFATTNRADLMDPAITMRLYSIQVPTVPLKELGTLFEQIAGFHARFKFQEEQCPQRRRTNAVETLSADDTRLQTIRNYQLHREGRPFEIAVLAEGL